MTLQAQKQVENDSPAPVLTEVIPVFAQNVHGIDTVELSPEERAALLDAEAWSPMLETYGRTMKLAVALTDKTGSLLGSCHNPQPMWLLVQNTTREERIGCPFCLAPASPCTAVAEALRSGLPTIVRDQAGLTHVAVPLSLGKYHLGAIVAGQVSEHYPESMLLQRVAKKFAVSPQLLWDLSGKQRPISHAALEMAGALLGTLGQAFLRQRYAAILETHVEHTNLRFRLLVEGVTDYALFTIDALGSVTSWNEGAKRMLGYSDGEILGQPFSRMFASEDVQSGVPERQLLRALKEGRTEDEGWRVREDQTRFWANIIITPLPQEADRPRGYALVMQDVTEKRKAALELEATRAERINLQEQFLSHVSHELRTPLTAIYFFITNLLEGVTGELTAAQREHLEFSLENVKQLKGMVSDLLDVSRIESLKLSVDPQQTFLPALVGEVLRTCLADAAAKNISLTSDIIAKLPAAWADGARTRQVLINLIENAIRFTPKNGSVAVRGAVFPKDSNFLCLSVTDTGSGITPENRLRIFDRLAQVKSLTEVSRKGLGLGLFISKELVSRQGGQIWVESQLGSGSSFSFTLPVFSLTKFSRSIFTAENLREGCVTLFSIQVPPVDGAHPAHVLPDLPKILKQCIVAGRELLLPDMNHGESGGMFFILACAEESVTRLLPQRLQDQLRKFGLKPEISATRLPLSASDQPTENRIAEVTARVEELIRAKFLEKEHLT